VKALAEFGVNVCSIRAEALLASVKPGGGGWHVPEDPYRLAAGAVVSEAVLERVVLVEDRRLRPGPSPGGGALQRLCGEVAAEPRAQTVRHWLEQTAAWAQDTIGEELAAAGAARLVRRRFLRVFLPQPQLEILDQGAQDEVYRIVRETLLGDHATMPETALLVLLAGSVRNHVQMKRRHLRRRFRELQESLSDDVQLVLHTYRKWEIRGAADG
jgi:Golgi phosphoprotein 3 (GPP34)